MRLTNAGKAAVALLLVSALLVTLWPKREVGKEPTLLRARLSFAWPEYHERLEIGRDERLDALAAALHTDQARPGRPEANEIYFELGLSWDDGRAVSLSITHNREVYDEAAGLALKGEALDEATRQLTGELERRFFGTPYPWNEVLARLPVGGKAEVRDLESGLRFQVYRHRGDAHADVEPLTPADADTLKAIYGGEWSWKRRAAILYLDGEQIAASMNGMPHGWGDLFDNEFVGHFCIHFEGSRVHTSWREDPGHQLMVAKAAGLLVETLDASGPEALVKWAVAAVNHREVVALRYLAAQGDTLPFSELFSRIAQPIRHITFIGARAIERDERLFSVGVLNRGTTEADPAREHRGI